ncbi:MAG: zraR 8 [Myxococcaceae bacterium]|nr:zraR 8 [Myxococcaceae bacterium]
MRAYADARPDAEREIVAHGVRAQALMEQVRELAVSDRSVLICGETGTGKTVIANALHAQSESAGQPLRLVNCAALSDALLADVMGELGEWAEETTSAGAELDTRSPRPARRIVLLDEIGELSPWSQAVLLRKLQHDARRLCVRFVAATHRNLDLMIQQGTFSRELIWRLNMARVAIAPLRERREEIVPLALHFLRLGLAHASERFVSADSGLFELIERYDWPGNVRELKNAMLRTLAANESGTLSSEDLPDAVRKGALEISGQSP